MSPIHHVHVPSPAEVVESSNREIPKSLKTTLLALFAVGVVIFIIGLFVAPDRVWNAWHANWLFFTALTSGGVTFVTVQRITTARWSRGVIRLMEGYVAFLPIALLFYLITFIFGRHYVFPWTHEAYPSQAKATYFNPTFFAIRDILVLVLMNLLGVWFIYLSVRLDVGHLPERGASWAASLRARMRQGFGEERREIHSTHSIQGKLAVLNVILFGYGWSVLAWDLSMGLSLHFQSTLYSWWFFMGGWLSALMLFAVLVRVWDSFLNSANGLITETHFHDIGKLCFAFTAFWGYLTFGQYLVIWYGNVGEETFFMRLRFIEPYVWVTVASVILIFFAPFFGLLGRAPKVRKGWMFLFAFSSLIGMWLMRYIEVYPSAYGVAPRLPFGIWEIGVLLLYAGLWGYVYVQFMDAFPRMRVTFLSSPFRDEVQVPVNPDTMEPLPAHE